MTELNRGTGLLSLIGPSGIGKTRLARQLANEFADGVGEEGGVWFCDLSGCGSAAELELAVARTLEIRLQQGEELARTIANRGPLLLILDNADSVAAQSAAVLERWLDRCVELQMIMTSIVPAEAPGEVRFELQPMDDSDAVELYLERARRAWADRSVSPDEESWVRELVRRLDRIPLAIELAAARVRVLPPRTLLSMFEKRFELLRLPPAKVEASGRVPQRKSSLISALDLTWSHLEPYEQIALARAAVFEGGFSVDALSAILGDDGQQAGTSASEDLRGAAKILEDLQRKSLIAQEEAQTSRYHLLESTRSYALQELRRMGLWDETLHRHASYFLDHEEAQLEWVEGPERATSIRWLKQERANLLAILHRFQDSDPGLAARAGITLIPLSRLEGYPPPDMEFPRSLLDVATRSGSPTLLARALTYLAALNSRHGLVDKATRSYEEATLEARAAGDGVLEAKTYLNLALHHSTTGDSERSQQALERAIPICEKIRVPSVTAQLQLAQAVSAFQRGALDEAEAGFTAALRMNGRVGLEAMALSGLALILASTRRLDEAHRLNEEGLRICRAHGYRALEAQLLDNYLMLEVAIGLLDEAEANARVSLAIHREIGNQFREAWTHSLLGLISLERGELDAAGEWLHQADELVSSRGATNKRRAFQVFLAITEAKRGQVEEASRILAELRSQLSVGAAHLPPSPIEYAEALVKVASAQQLRRSAPECATRYIEEARAYLADAISRERNLPAYLPVLHRLLETALGEWASGAPAPSPGRSRPRLLVDVERGWFQVSASPRVELRDRRLLRALFAALVQARLEVPGDELELYELIETGWPGADLAPERMNQRLYVAIRALRNLGLRNIILTGETGYLLDPNVIVQELNEATYPPDAAARG